MIDDRARMAIFIDVENFGVAAIPFVLDELRADWNIYLRRAYGTGLAQHQKVLRENGITAIELSKSTPGKNSADIALVFDLAREFCSGRANGFAICSSDGDFATIAAKIREEGHQSIVFGRNHSPVALRNCCSEFHLIGGGTHHQNAEQQRTNNKHAGTRVFNLTLDQVQLRNELSRILDDYTINSAQISLVNFSNLVKQRHSGISPKHYGCRSWSSLLRKLGCFELHPITNGAGIVINYKVSSASKTFE